MTGPSVLDRLPPRLLREGRRLWSHPRYWYQRWQARAGFRRHGDRYPQPLLFVAGLPKSGTSWLESMLSSYPGYRSLMLPDAVEWEVEHGGSHDFRLPPDLFERLEGLLAVLKLHASGEAPNAELLNQRGLRYVILFRDLRDVAVSHHFYVSRTPWHPEHEAYARRDVEEGLLHFADTLLDPFADWIRSWLANRDPDLSVVVTYEEMLADTESAFGRVAEHLGLDDGKERVGRIVRKHEFERKSGREQGKEDQESFMRKGVSGDWKNHFTPRVEERFERQAGELLEKLGSTSAGNGDHGCDASDMPGGIGL